MEKYFILLIEDIDKIEWKQFKEKIDLAIDWLKIMPNSFILRTTSSTSVWYARLHPILSNTTFFISEINIDNRTGLMSKSKWNWLNKYK
ncbi:hypothetical protein [Brachyspira hyodysenteriae]|uniref:hypothetical protein n=1 Tax=Brachyspira hyodysenteriae TaxID=159 RepID=UPI00063DCA2C|nr:hypothetical protein [Brachyspira hyodysenteriae]KLI59518.1 hypothetical protein SZ44_08325 [Brachyspira hyodysenteriae]